MSNTLKKVQDLLIEHHNAFENAIPLIASENVTSIQCREACNSDLSHRYAEGWPGERVYAGCEWLDQIEQIAIDLAKKYFRVNFADVRPISGVVANLVAYTAYTEPGDIMSCMPIPSGGHISHGPKYGRVSKNLINGTAGAVHGLDIEYLKFNWEEMNIDVDQSIAIIREKKPKLLLFGGSVFLFPHPVKELSEVAREVGAKVMYDGAHVLGLIGSGYFQDPLREGADIMTGSTHKTFPGPQHGIVLSDTKDSEEIELLKKCAFPAMLSNHHLHNVAGLAITLAEMLEFGIEYHAQVIKNAKALAQALHERGFKILCEHKGFTESHQVVADITNFENTIGLGGDIEKALEKANIIINRNLLPWDIVRDNRNYTNPGGIRLGVSEVTRLGMKERDMVSISELMKKIVVDQKKPEVIKEEVEEFRKDFQTLHYCFPTKTRAYEYISFK
ncbi:MAG: serine hydroxymethyltransferase [Candidatus Lokiarchaeota archaeon]|nr:serine hydroxymethyltransferase [Candidatus Lokiarchaeota archaeon]